ncbi:MULTISPECIES: cobalt-precorrin-6A reductase [unclassified Fusobacterium]|uniref:cobalt-precorrin-6A reductase n=1 Tax=Fusobacterium sp. TaxID=68766 RepID=UPI0025C63ADC|nr:cobalt-precorrin-6A reductase [Fusobacterium sp.]
MIWVVGGTKDSREFLEKFCKKTTDIIVTTATEYGGKLLENLPVRVVCQKLTYPMMLDFIEKESIDKVIDLSHPYAVEVSENVLKASKDKKIEYFRFEREEISFLPKLYKEFEKIEDIIKYIAEKKGNILVTLGSNNIPFFSQLNNLNQCYFRILPKWDMVKKCEDLGILPKNIIAMQGPFSKSMNKAMIEQYDIKYIITKQAGNTGGEREKIEAAEESGIEVIFLTRPKIDYPNCYNSIDELLLNVEKRE